MRNCINYIVVLIDTINTIALFYLQNKTEFLLYERQR